MIVLDVVGMVMLMRRRTHRHMRHVVVVNSVFLMVLMVLMVSHAGWCAQHGCRHSAPDREQDGKQYQEPDAKRFHKNQVSTVTVHECTHRV